MKGQLKISMLTVHYLPVLSFSTIINAFVMEMWPDSHRRRSVPCSHVRRKPGTIRALKNCLLPATNLSSALVDLLVHNKFPFIMNSVFCVLQCIRWISPNHWQLQPVDFCIWLKSLWGMHSLLPSPKPWTLGEGLPPLQMLSWEVPWQERTSSEGLSLQSLLIICIQYKSLLSAANYWQLKQKPCKFLLLAIYI